MSSTTALMIDSETGLYLLFFSVVFLFFLVWLLYIFWPVKDNIDIFK